MANDYNKVYLQIIFAVKYRKALLDKSWRDQLFAYTAKTLTNRGHYSLAANGYNDHVHIFIHYSAKELISDLVREIKKSMSNFIKTNNLCKSKFKWQFGYDVFSYSYREKSKIINYVNIQERHHQTKNFKKEYRAFLNKFEIEFKEEYLFDFLEMIK